MAGKTIRELTSNTAPAPSRLVVTQDPSSGEPTKSTIAQMLGAAAPVAIAAGTGVVGLTISGENGVLTPLVQLTKEVGVLSERPESASQNGWPWRTIVNQNEFVGGGPDDEDYWNEVVAIGWNLSGTVGLPATEGEPAFWDAWEAKYNYTGTSFAFERHFQMIDTNGIQRRVFSFGLPHDGGSGSGALYAIDRIDWFEFDADTPVIQWQIKNRSAFIGDFTDAFIFHFEKNNSPIIRQRNAADSSFLDLPYFNASDQLVIGGRILSAAAHPGNTSAAHEFSISGAIGSGGSLLSLAAGTAQTDVVVNGLVAQASTNWDFQAVFQNNNSGSGSGAVLSCQTAASAGLAYIRTGYTAGQQWSIGMNGSQNFALSAASNLGADLIFTADRTNKNVAFNAPPRVPTYTVATLPDAATFGAGSLVYVSDETGGAVLAFASGGVWLRSTDRATVS